jgi:hypothetical protein
MLKKMMSVLLTLIFTCLAFFSLGDFGLFPRYKIFITTAVSTSNAELSVLYLNKYEDK